LIMLFTMVFTSMLAGLRLARDHSWSQLKDCRRPPAKTIGAAPCIRFR
jgi:hypothetical protein